MRYRRQSLLPRLLLWLIILAGIGFAGWKWGGQGLAWIRANLLGARPAPAPVSESALIQPDYVPTQQAGQQTSDREVELAPDGFPVQPRRHVLRYTVQPGDALFLIADRFGLDPNTIFWANTETLQDNVHLLHVGVELYILPVDGVYHLSDGTQTIAEIAAQYGVMPGDILYSEFNDLADKDSNYIPPAGLHIVVPGGQRQYASWASPVRTGSRGVANPEGLLHPGSCRELYTGPGGTGDYWNPLGDIPYRVTNGFAPWHPGVDMAADANTPVYAADTGVVVFAGWHRDGYGELVILDHGNGWTTYYGHLATRFVGCGDQVSRGQLIGQMGMTGNATGIHLHFEMRKDDVPQNPYLYIPIQDIRSSGG
jgi:murein DD-endopeptidase MepM/ murein hydrolase activator NlpD